MGAKIGKLEFKGFANDRSKTQVEIDSKIDVSAKAFRKLGNPDGIQEEENQFYEGDGDVTHGVESWVVPIPKCSNG